jgi:hypothetical protein
MSCVALSKGSDDTGGSALLRRDAGPGGLFGGVDALNRGVRDEELIAAIVASDEYFLRAQ